ncbi:MAG: hypothetical protein K2P26_06525, partial [Oscillospiraceae bacterium]|nr:hypothetical protein [Oscillospiraceae bacterium]
MKFKKLVSTALAGAMALSLSVPAFAADGDLQQSTDITGTTQAPTNAITIPAPLALKHIRRRRLNTFC